VLVGQHSPAGDQAPQPPRPERWPSASPTPGAPGSAERRRGPPILVHRADARPPRLGRRPTPPGPGPAPAPAAGTATDSRARSSRAGPAPLPSPGSWPRSASGRPPPRSSRRCPSGAPAPAAGSRLCVRPHDRQRRGTQTWSTRDGGGGGAIASPPDQVPAELAWRRRADCLAVLLVAPCGYVGRNGGGGSWPALGPSTAGQVAITPAHRQSGSGVRGASRGGVRRADR
jgi:hypothetical protein